MKEDGPGPFKDLGARSPGPYRVVGKVKGRFGLTGTALFMNAWYVLPLTPSCDGGPAEAPCLRSRCGDSSQAGPDRGRVAEQGCQLRAESRPASDAKPRA